MKFTDLPLSEGILKGIADAGFTECTQAQAETYTHAFNGKDVCVQSQTGTGKTAAYLITIFKLFSDAAVKPGRALIMVPTRELAVQIDKETKFLGKHLNYKSATFFGGVGYGQQESALETGVDILIATPGRLIDLFKSGKVKLDDISILVIDEADRMFDMGFIPDIRYLIKKMPGSKDRRTLLFSATLSQKVKGLAWEYMTDPVEIDIMPEQLTVAKITQYLYHVGGDEKFRLLLGLLKKYNPKNAIIFTNMKHTAEVVSKRLSANGYSNEYIMGDLPQKKRQKVIDGVKNGEIRFLVATDVAARGLHVDDLDMVFNYDIPEDCENYVHRIGRTARAGKEGIAISLACEKYVQGLEGIEEFIKQKIPVEWFDEDLIIEDLSAGMRFSRDRNDRGRDDRGRDGRGRKDGRDSRVKDSRYGRKEPYKKDAHRKEYGDRPPAHKATLPHVERKPAAVHPKPEHAVKAPHKEIHHHKKAVPVHQNKKGKVARRDGSLEERMEYYRQKYGEDFKMPEQLLKGEKKSKKGIVKKILSVFGKKKAE